MKNLFQAAIEEKSRLEVELLALKNTMPSPTIFTQYQAHLKASLFKTRCLQFRRRIFLEKTIKILADNIDLGKHKFPRHNNIIFTDDRDMGPIAVEFDSETAKLTFLAPSIDGGNQYQSVTLEDGKRVTCAPFVFFRSGEEITAKDWCDYQDSMTAFASNEDFMALMKR